MSNFNITNLQKVLPPSWKRRKKIIFNPIFQDNDDLEEIKKLISIKMYKYSLINNKKFPKNTTKENLYNVFYSLFLIFITLKRVFLTTE